MQLNRYFLKSLHFNLKPGFAYGSPVDTTEIRVPPLEIGVVSAEQHPDDPAQWQFEVSIELPDVDEYICPYTVETTLIGYFTVDADFPEDQAEVLARTNGPAVLYSCAREIVGAITGRSPYPKLLIPSVTFFQRKKQQKEIEEVEVKQLPEAKNALDGS